MKKWIALIGAAVILTGGLSACSAGRGVTLYDKDGGVLATPRSTEKIARSLTDDTYESYVTCAVEEAVAILASLGDGDEAKARNALFRGGYTVHTTFDTAAHRAVKNAYAAYQKQGVPFGCATLDDDGAILTVFSGGGALYALDTHAPCSTLKPLSVYAPALEFGVADWCTRWKDSPYKTLTDLKGEVSFWPVNARGEYTQEPTPMYECVQQSLNTTAVHCLKKVGVNRSLNLLNERLGMNVAYEQNKAVLQGEEEVIGNVAMGFLYTGFTPVQMAGYFGVFGNKGKYDAPHCIAEIRNADGEVVYTYKRESVRVFSEETAYVTNRLLRGVVLPGGTARSAKVDGVELIGKTGTSDGNNWFVGVTPEYACAVWHGDMKEGNVAARMFTEVFAKMPPHEKTTFSAPASVKRVVCCMDSGLKATSSCRDVQVGYYAADRIPTVCDEH